MKDSSFYTTKVNLDHSGKFQTDFQIKENLTSQSDSPVFPIICYFLNAILLFQSKSSVYMR